MGNSRTFVITEGAPFNQAVLFPVQTVIVANTTASWLYVGDASWPVPPFQYGVTIPLNSANTSPVISWSTPNGLTVPTAGKGSATVIFTDDVLPHSNGVPIVTPSQQVVCGIVSSTSSGVGNSITVSTDKKSASLSLQSFGTTTLVVTLPAGTNSILITGSFGYTANADSSFPTLVVSVTGGTTGTVYMLTANVPTPQEPQPPWQCTVSPAADSQIAVVFSASGVDAAAPRIVGTGIEVVASFGGAAIAVEGSGSANPVAVNLTNVNGVQGLKVPISQGGTTPTFIVGAGNAAVSLVFNPVLLLSRRLHTLTVSYSGATAGAPNVSVLTNGSTVWETVVRDAGATSYPGHFTFPNGGMIIATPGLGASITLTASGVAGVVGVISATYTVEA